MIAPTAATSSIWQKGRQYLIMVLAPIDSAAVGVLEIAAHNGLRSVAIINQDALLPKAVAKGTYEIARSKGLEVVFFETYPDGTADFSGILNKIEAAKPDVLVTASVRLDDLVTITRQMRELGLDAKMSSSLPYGFPSSISGSGRMRSSSTAPRSGRRLCRTRGTGSSSRPMRRNSIAHPPFSRPPRMRGAKF